jgi:cytochrome b
MTPIVRRTKTTTARAPKQRIWDLPIRLFHWTLAALIGLSWWSAEEHKDALHLWSGMAILTLLLFRILWGFFGSSTARFSSFVRGPASVFAYLRGQWRGIGHTPLGALSVLALLLVLALQVGLGLVAQDEDGLMAGPLANLVGLSTSEAATELHESLFNILLALIALHIAAIAYYRLFRRKDLVTPMITGRGHTDTDDGMRPGKWWAALLCLVAAIALTRWIIAGAPPFGG